MEDRETRLIERLKAQIESGETVSFAFMEPPVSQEELADAENMLGFELPSAIESPSLYQWLEGWLNKTFHFDWDAAEKITFSSEH